MFQINLPFPEHWEYSLETQLLHEKDRLKRSVYICSPCRGDTAKETHRNILAARAYMFLAMTHLNCRARAPHGYISLVMSDRSHYERSLALAFGARMLESCDEIFVCGDRLSVGMRGEIEHAARLGIPVTVFAPELGLDTVKLVTRCGADKKLVTQENRYPELGMNSGELFAEAASSADILLHGRKKEATA